MNRLLESKDIILDAIQGSPTNAIPIGDKSSPRDIDAYFHGMSKSDFKNGVGKLYKEGLVVPGPYETILVTEENPLPKKAREPTKKQDKSNADNLTIFIGNLASNIGENNIRNMIIKRLQSESSKIEKDAGIKEIRLVYNKDTHEFKGFGYVEFVDDHWYQLALDKLKSVTMNGRKIRIDQSTNSEVQVDGNIKEQKRSETLEKPKKVLDENIPRDMRLSSDLDGNTINTIISKRQSKPWVRSSERTADDMIRIRSSSLKHSSETAKAVVEGTIRSSSMMKRWENDDDEEEKITPIKLTSKISQAKKTNYDNDMDDLVDNDFYVNEEDFERILEPMMPSKREITTRKDVPIQSRKRFVVKGDSNGPLEPEKTKQNTSQDTKMVEKPNTPESKGPEKKEIWLDDILL